MARIQLHTNIIMNMCIYKRCVCKYVYLYIYMNYAAYLYTYIYVLIHICLHIHVHTHTRTDIAYTYLLVYPYAHMYRMQKHVYSTPDQMNESRLATYWRPPAADPRGSGSLVNGPGRSSQQACGLTVPELGSRSRSVKKDSGSVWNLKLESRAPRA